ncbi:MAG: efflux RND transporter permease subunit [Methylococcales bacterium]|nr:efflux RND transporter permease subunit [Methylococcales bacterium]
MNLSEYFIYRPIATSLLTLAISLAGLIAFFQLPIAPLPQVDFPTISVQASLPGASPEIMSSSVATPLERALGHIAGITEITSASSMGTTSIMLQFDINRDIDGAARDVQAAINAANNLLPGNMPNRPSYKKINPADSPIMILALTSETMTRGQLYDAASTILAQKISQFKGVGQVTVGGSSLPAVRIQLNPVALAKYGIGFEEVRATIAASNVNRPKGALENATHHLPIYANDQAKTASEYLPLIVTYKNGAAIRLSDLGQALDSVEDLRSAGLKDNQPAILLIINKQAGANIIETVDKIKSLLPQLQASIPSACKLSMVLDRSITIRASLHEVERSLLIAIVLVILIVFLFLRDLRSAMIPIITIPVSLLGTFGVMYLCHYSLDNLSLMALTIATGFVVDDAIVVLENTSRHMEQGTSPRQAALKAAGEVGFTVLTMSLSLVAVFIPILLMGGIVGRLFQEFAVILSAAVLISLVISLTTTPMLCALLLRPLKIKTRSHLYHFTEQHTNRLLTGYEHTLRWALRNSPLVMLLLLCTIGLNIYLYTIVPKGFFPIQDTGRLSGTIQADQSISSQAMQKKLADFVAIMHQDPEIETVIGFTGGQRSTNSGQLFATLKPLEERQLSVDKLMTRLRGKLKNEPGAQLILQSPQDLRIGARGSSALFEYTLQTDNLEELRTWVPQIVKALSKRTELVDVNTNQQDNGQQISLQVDRDFSSRLGLSQTLINSTLNNAFGQRQISLIYNSLNQYRVIMEVTPEFSQSAETLKNIYINAPAVPSLTSRGQIPFSTFVTYSTTNTPLSINHQSQFPAGTISFNLKPGTSLSTASQAITETMSNLGVPASIHGSFQGTAKAFKESLNDQPWLILAALISIYIVLGILYESYIHPLTILSTLPSAGIGAILALIVFKTEFSIIAMIGVILLIGIVKKNAIMMIDFALNAERTLAMSPKDAIFNACLMRFRPIMMTTFAALLAALPLALGSGYGSELRRPLGIAIVGGLVFSQVLTLYSTPVIYLYLDRFQSWCRRTLQRKASIPFSNSTNLL